MEMEQDRKRVGNISSEQKILLVEFMENHPKLTKGKFTSDFAHKDGQKLWSEIGDILNGVPGAKKDWKQWRKTWQDMRNKTKSVRAAVSRDIRATGGGVPTTSNIIDAIDDRVAGLLDATAVIGDRTVQESIVEFDLNIDNGDPGDIVDYLIQSEESVEGIQYEKVDSFETVKEPESVSNDRTAKDTNMQERKKQKLSVPSRRLERSLQQCQDIVSVSQADLDMRQKYFDARLRLLKEQVEAQKRIAAAKENQVRFQEQIAATANRIAEFLVGHKL